ncbi:histidine kinase [Sphingobacterium sp. Ag1]|uniref:sensor histidine kinase n=1 Tax=Sphingobacterium sp. Ag1 TaxID=1643451 RepID=UPI00062780EA|nr:HAMP domain-containing sensor histidine kinase [Sphingobacterium sp. Ag1]KKO89511.1 histidine kinase [Sphingobacterium sp. Ag1]
MKPLLRKITTPFLLYVLIVLGVSIPVYYFVIDGIWKSELDEHNEIIVKKTAYELNRLQLSEDRLQASIALWNSIQPETNIQKVRPGDLLQDSVYTIEKPQRFVEPKTIDRFRCLSSVIQINGVSYRFTVQTNIEESVETIAAIAATTLFFFVILVIGLLILSRRISLRLWKPFRDTVNKLKAFNLNSQQQISFQQTDTIEFHELNQSLSKLLEQNLAVYRSQKEFTENASHELQTPLAILKNKLDILLQSPDLSNEQYQLFEDMHKALSRSSRINRNLLLLAKIDNSQFDHSESIPMHRLVSQCIEVMQEHFELKNLLLLQDIQPSVLLTGNSSLTEILINNLLLNAIRYSDANDTIAINLTQAALRVHNPGSTALDKKLLFKRFSKLSKNSQGSGLGLAIITEIARYQGWTVDYHFENNQHIFSIHF